MLYFSSIFFDDVEVPAANIVLGVDQGWMLANTLLEAERMMSSSPQKVIVMLDRVKRVALQTGACDAGITSSTSLISFRLEEVAKSLTSGAGASYWFMLEPLMIVLPSFVNTAVKTWS